MVHLKSEAGTTSSDYNVEDPLRHINTLETTYLLGSSTDKFALVERCKHRLMGTGIRKEGLWGYWDECA